MRSDVTRILVGSVVALPLVAAAFGILTAPYTKAAYERFFFLEGLTAVLCL